MKKGVFGDIKNFQKSKIGKELIGDATTRAFIKANLLKKNPYLNNLIPDSLDCLMPIYRIETLADFLSNFKNNLLYFSHPKKWLLGKQVDSIILRKKVFLPDGSIADHKYFEDTFCQCWSKKQSMNFWEKYSRGVEYKNIMMVSSVDKIMRSLENFNTPMGYSEKFWAGEATFRNFDDDGINILIKSDEEVNLFLNRKTIAGCYLEKRSSYYPDAEIRFVVNGQEADSGKDFTMVSLTSDFKNILDGVVLDPRMPPDSKKQISRELVNMGLKIVEGSRE